MGMDPSRVRLFSDSLLFSVLNDEVKLVTADEKKTVIAEFRHAQHFINRQKAKLEVQPAGIDMLDYVILTFVIVEQTRRERLGWWAKCM